MKQPNMIPGILTVEEQKAVLIAERIDRSISSGLLPKNVQHLERDDLNALRMKLIAERRTAKGARSDARNALVRAQRMGSTAEQFLTLQEREARADAAYSALGEAMEAIEAILSQRKQEYAKRNVERRASSFQAIFFEVARQYLEQETFETIEEMAREIEAEDAGAAQVSMDEAEAAE